MLNNPVVQNLKEYNPNTTNTFFNMSDTQGQVKMVAEQALANLVERAKRLQLSSVSTIDPSATRITIQTLSDCNITVNNSKTKTKVINAAGPGTQRAMAATARKPRKMDLEPSPPPPSPREPCMIAELRDEYHQTDQLIDKMLTDATVLSRDMIYCSQHQRDLTLVQEIEIETAHRSLDTLFEALSAECERQDLKEIMRRCCCALERSKERVYSDPHKSIMDAPHTLYDGLPNYASIQEAIADELMPPESLADNLNELASDNGNVSPNKLQLDSKSGRKTPEGMPQNMAIAEQITK
ncbi:uncharacterized protein LOC117789461 [Drosophila innubila]|uniref:uncharacterized protein LOC117789461 n=1 Tax=Drosophila innubila TaxID=198719 RepID=UPI00148E6502|nr:uncharacterized protein LOC117789461 [Drosophila innubila]